MSPSNQRNGNGSGKAPGDGKPGESIFKAKPPSSADKIGGHAKKVSEVLGEVVWLMSQSPVHKQFFIADLEWFVMAPVLLQQFRMFYADDRPVGVLLWAFVSDEVEERLAQGITKLRPQDCPRGTPQTGMRGDKLWVLRQQANEDVEAIAPFGRAEARKENAQKRWSRTSRPRRSRGGSCGIWRWARAG